MVSQAPVDAQISVGFFVYLRVEHSDSSTVTCTSPTCPMPGWHGSGRWLGQTSSYKTDPFFPYQSTPGPPHGCQSHHKGADGVREQDWTLPTTTGQKCYRSVLPGSPRWCARTQKRSRAPTPWRQLTGQAQMFSCPAARRAPAALPLTVFQRHAAYCKHLLIIKS